MPRNLGTSRKGKPGKNERAVGFGQTLKRAQGNPYKPKANGKSQGGGGMAQQVGVASLGGTGTGASTASTSLQISQEQLKTRSVLELHDIDDFLLQAELANREFVAERHGAVVLDSTAQAYRPTTSSRVRFEGDATATASSPDFVFRELSVPRRPEWDDTTTPQELERREQHAFVEWRRGIALKEDALMRHSLNQHRPPSSSSTQVSVTPFEKNLEVWRQLWRVLERSNCIVQLVDARNPLFYLSHDLRDYATTTLNKPMMVVINKSDYLTSQQRQVWYEYLQKQGWEVVFFSAHDEQHKLDQAAQEQRKREEQQMLLQQETEYNSNDNNNNQNDSHREDSDSEEGEDDEHDDDLSLQNDDASATKPVDDDEEAAAAAAHENPFSSPNDDDGDGDNDGDAPPSSSSSMDGKGIDQPLTRQELLNVMLEFARKNDCPPDPRYESRIPFGMVGFPNVGKSSVINVLMGNSKHTHGLVRVAVAAQPGKTKHFQTLLLNDDMLLCDCPGLVFPSFVSNTADLIAAGVYPIAQMRDHWPVTELICQRIPRPILNAQYGIQLPIPTEPSRFLDYHGDNDPIPPPTAEELLSTYCYARGMLAASSGVPDYPRAARLVIQDYAAGKLLYCHPPPSLDDEETRAYHRETLITALNRTKLHDKLQKLQQPQHYHDLEKESLSGTDAGVDVTRLLHNDFEQQDILDLLDVGAASSTIVPLDKTSRRKHAKKNRKNRNKDPYGCHSTPDDTLAQSVPTTGVGVRAGKYSQAGAYTRPTSYAGARSAVPPAQHE